MPDSHFPTWPDFTVTIHRIASHTVQPAATNQRDPLPTNIHCVALHTVQTDATILEADNIAFVKNHARCHSAGWPCSNPYFRVPCDLLFAMHLATRRVHFVGCTPNPGGPWMQQMARNLTDAIDGLLLPPIRYLLLDRDTKFTAEFQATLTAAGVEPVLLAPRSPNCNAHLERFFRSLKEEALDRMIFFSEDALRKAAAQFVTHYHTERNHQGLDHRIIEPGPEVGQLTGDIVCRERLGGTLKYYYRKAA